MTTHKKQIIIAISGISGAGKTTIGKVLAYKMNGIFIDQDWFFKKQKPIVTLSSGVKVLNYDSDESLDIIKFNDFIINKLHLNKPIIISGFALKDSFFHKMKPSLHFHIKIPKELSLETRLKVKKFSQERKNKETLVFNEYVYPYYEETLKKSSINYFIDGVDYSGKRKNLTDIINQIVSKMQTLL